MTPTPVHTPGPQRHACFSASRSGSAAAQAVGSPPSLSPFSEWWTCSKVICVLTVTHAPPMCPQLPGKTQETQRPFRSLTGIHVPG